MNIISLLDGCSGAYQALQLAGIKIDKYYASEIEKYPISVSAANFPDIVNFGDVQNIYTHWGLMDNNFGFGIQASVDNIDLLIGGSPCQDLSIAKNDRKGLQGERSGLFYEYVRILNEVKPKFFILENVASMPKEAKEEITKILGVEPIMINSALVTAQQRKRLYWVGKRKEDGTYETVQIDQPQDRKIYLRDILEDIPLDDPMWRPLDEKYIGNIRMKLQDKAYSVLATYGKVGQRDFFEKGNRQIVVEKSETLTANYQNGASLGNLNTPRERTLVFGQFRRGSNLRIHDEQNKSCALTANMGTGGNNVPVLITSKAEEGKIALGLAHRNRGRGKEPECNMMEKANSLTTVQSDSEVLLIENTQYFWRPLTVRECARLQGMSDDFDFSAVSKTQAYKMIGNGFNIPTIAHLLSYLK